MTYLSNDRSILALLFPSSTAWNWVFPLARTKHSRSIQTRKTVGQQLKLAFLVYPALGYPHFRRGVCEGLQCIWVCLSVCLSGRVTPKILLRLNQFFFTQEVLYPWLGPALRWSGSGIWIWTEKNLFQRDSSPLGDRIKYAIKVRHVRQTSVRPLFFYFLVYGFLGRKNGSVGREKKKKNSK